MANLTIKLCDLFETTKYFPSLYTREEVEGWFKNYQLSDFLTPLQIETIEKTNVWSKDKLAEKIVDHYYMREIAYETPTLFKHFAKVKMNEIMEKYLQFIYSKFIEYDPLSSVDYTETYEREIINEGLRSGTGKANESTEGSGNSNSKNFNSNTPQNNLTDSDLKSYVDSHSLTENEGDSKENRDSENEYEESSEGKMVEKYTHSKTGDDGIIVTNQYLIREYRELSHDIDSMIIKELKCLFSILYN